MIPNRHPKFSGGKNIHQKPLRKFLASNQPKAAYSEKRQSEGVIKSINDHHSKPLLQFWGCEEPHYYKNFLHKARTGQL